MFRSPAPRSEEAQDESHHCRRSRSVYPNTLRLLPERSRRRCEPTYDVRTQTCCRKSAAGRARAEERHTNGRSLLDSSEYKYLFVSLLCLRRRANKELNGNQNKAARRDGRRGERQRQTSQFLNQPRFCVAFCKSHYFRFRSIHRDYVVSLSQQNGSRRAPATAPNAER